VLKITRVFDNTDTSHSAKKSELKTIWAKIELLNLALYVTYGLKFKAINNKHAHYYLVSSFDSENSPKLPSYQTGKEVYWDNEKDTWYAYSKLTFDKLLINTSLDSSKVNNTQIPDNIQNLFDIC